MRILRKNSETNFVDKGSSRDKHGGVLASNDLLMISFYFEIRSTTSLIFFTIYGANILKNYIIINLCIGKINFNVKGCLLPA